MSETRTEKDSLGPIEVPAEALYGAQTMRAVHNFPISGMRPYRAFVWSMATIKQAAARVHMDLGLLDVERGQAIVQAAQEVVDGRWDDQFVVDPFQAGAGTSHNMNVNEVIANRANQILGHALDPDLMDVLRIIQDRDPVTDYDRLMVRLFDVTKAEAELEPAFVNESDPEQVKLYKTARVLNNDLLYAGGYLHT